MNIIDEYVIQVTNILPDSQKHVVSEDLTKKIMDMLPENYSEDDIHKVLSELGKPEEVAKQYIYKNRYLIGPQYFNSYLAMVKLVSVILIVVVCASTLIESVVNFNGEEGIISFIIHAITDMISSSIQGFFQIFFFVTITYFFLEQSKFDTAKLPFINYRSAEKTKGKQSVFKIVLENLLSIIFSAFFTYIICFKSEWIGWYTYSNNKLQNILSLFDEQVLNRFVIPLLFLFGLLMFISILKMIYKKRTLLLAITNAVYQVLVIGVYTVMLKTDTLFTTAFKNKFQDTFNLTNYSFQNAWSGILTTILVVIIITSIIDAIFGIVDWKKGKPL